MKKTIFVMGIVGLLCGLVCMTFSSCFGSSSTGAPPSNVNVVEVDLYTLLSEWDDNSLRAKQQYGDKTIRTTGEIYNIFTDGSVMLQVNALEYYFMSMMMMGINTTTIKVYFNKAETAKLASLRQEQGITVRGVYDGDRNVIRNAVIETEPQQQAQPTQQQAQQQPAPTPQPAPAPQPTPTPAPATQTGQITLQVRWVPASGLLDNDLAKNNYMAVLIDGIDGTHLPPLKWGESKEITLPNGRHHLYVAMSRENNKPEVFKPVEVSFNATSGRVVVNATPRTRGILRDDRYIELTMIEQP
jgi:hypothetical protein